MSKTPKLFTLYFQIQPSPTVFPLGHVVVMSGNLGPDSSPGHVTLGKLLVHLRGMTTVIYLTGWL